MARQRVDVDVSQDPALLELAREVQRTGGTIVLSAKGEALARVSPATPSRRPRSGKRTSADDPIWNIVGMGRSGQPANVSEHVDEFLTAFELSGNQP